MRYKGYDLPGDFLLIIRVFWRVMYFRRTIHLKPLPEIIDSIKKAAAGQDMHEIPEENEYEMLEKVSRASDFLLLRIIRTPRPCLPRSLTVFYWCSHNGITARIAVGVKKSQKLLEGHSWVLIEARPFREDLQHLNEYTIMLEGSN
ncbi:MAG: lasso peptide biosynthesis B2 protein [Syntrophomonadaceae bacterium]|nr:lasso peptide biosynthesis B2 protein [Syntrophomonadaceae bacterium]